MSRSIIASDLLTGILLDTFDSIFDQDYSTTVPTLGNGRMRTVVRRVIHFIFEIWFTSKSTMYVPPSPP
jgi:hypothetical protein